MINSIVSAVMNWIAMSVLMPIGMWLADYWRIKKENKDLKVTIEAIRNAKTKTDIDSAYDKLP